MKNKHVLLLGLLPLVMGFTKTDPSMFFMMIFIELFISIHMSIFVLWPLSKIWCPYNMSQKKFFGLLFLIRAIILIIFDLIGLYSIAMFDFFMVFIGAFIIVPLSPLLVKGIKKKSLDKNPIYQQINMCCKKCGYKLDNSMINCPECGNPSHIYNGQTLTK